MSSLSRPIGVLTVLVGIAAAQSACGDDESTSSTSTGGATTISTGSANGGSGGNSSTGNAAGGTSSGGAATGGNGGNIPSGLTPAHGTFIGGGAWERAQGVYIDDAGFIYVAGQTHSTDFPSSNNAYDQTKAGADGNGGQLERADGYVAKLAPDGSTVVWATLLGGTRRDAAYGVRTDAAGNVYVVGATGSDDFPTTPGAYDRVFNGAQPTNGLGETFVAKLSPDGSSLLFSTFVGGSTGGEENPRASLYVDEAAGRIFVAGTNAGNTDYPATPNAVQGSYGGGSSDGFVFALSIDGSQLLAATYLGGSGSDMAYSTVVPGPNGSIYVAGATTSGNFPGVTPNVVQNVLASGSPSDPWWQGDAWVARLSPDLDNIIFATYFGGTGGDAVSHNQGLAVDLQGRPVIYGNTQSDDLPMGGAGYMPTAPTDLNSGFVATISADGTSVVHGTYFGGNGSEEFSGVSVGPNGRIFVTGGTASTDFPLSASPLSGALNGPYDAFFAVFSPNLSGLSYSTYLGGSGNGAGAERGRGTWVGIDGHAVVVGATDSNDFPTPGAGPQQTFGGDSDGFLIGFLPAAN